ncbi:MAG TPA: energy transducer TonB [Mesorhizobium sp.]|uniref:energy transducer TonB n=1 Tax=Mesorhizobium sp. TaxID=1871066 RepID=UPI002DDD97A1|nr:energy transducer TonB [Mesorhizobium sp.]HEV2507214.1 energy transducer TonB [Mesorhizobium sp.]
MTAAAAQGGLFGGLSRRELALWSGAALIVASIHAGGGWYLGSGTPEAALPPAAPPAVMLDLPPMVINADTVPLDTADPIDSEAAETPQEVKEEIKPVEQEVAQPVEEVTEPEPMAEATKPEVAEEVVPDLVEAPLPEVAMAIPEPRPDIEKPKPVTKPVREKKPIEKKKPEPVKEAKVEKPEKIEKKAPVNSVAQQKAARAGANTQMAGGSGSAGSSVSPAQWKSRVGAHLMRYRRSITAGRRGGGDALVRFTFNSGGSILSVALARSSGDKSLDDAAVSMVRRASPIPAPPSTVTVMFLTVPVGSTR